MEGASPAARCGTSQVSSEGGRGHPGRATSERGGQNTGELTVLVPASDWTINKKL